MEEKIDIIEIKKCAYTLKNNSQLLIDNYHRICCILNNMYGILNKYSPDDAKIINNLINRYEEMMELINIDFEDYLDGVIRYTDNFMNSINELSTRIQAILSSQNIQLTKHDA